jgi:hypothetical protein
VDEALEQLGLSDISSSFTIELDHPGVNCESPGWFLIEDEDSHFSLVPDI